MSGLTAATSKGFGFVFERDGFNLRNSNAVAMEKGGIYTLDFLAQGTGVKGRYAADPSGGPGAFDDPWGNADLVVGSATRSTWPCVIADENIAVGRRGKVWVSHPDIMAIADSAGAASGATFAGAPLVADHRAGTNGVRYPNVDGDIINGGFARLLGWSHEGVDNSLAGFIRMAFNGLELGLLGQLGATP